MARIRCSRNLPFQATFDLQEDGQLEGARLGREGGRSFGDLLADYLDYSAQHAQTPFFDDPRSLVSRDQVIRLLADEVLPGDRLARYIAAELPRAIAHPREVREAAMRERLAKRPEQRPLLELEEQAFARGRRQLVERLFLPTVVGTGALAASHQAFGSDLVTLLRDHDPEGNGQNLLRCLAGALGVCPGVLTGTESPPEGIDPEQLAAGLARALTALENRNDPLSFERWYRPALTVFGMTNPRPETPSLGQGLMRLRAYAGLTQVELARRAGLAEATIVRYESDAAIPSAARANQIAEALGLGAEERNRWQAACRTARADSPLSEDASFADRLQASRREAGLSQQELHRRGIHPQTLRAWEWSWRLPPAGRIATLADAYGLEGPEREQFLAARFSTQLAEVARPSGWGKLVRAYRELAGLTRSQLGDRIGCTVSQVERWEVEGRVPAGEMLPIVSRVLREALAVSPHGDGVFKEDTFHAWYARASERVHARQRL